MIFYPIFNRNKCSTQGGRGERGSWWRCDATVEIDVVDGNDNPPVFGGGRSLGVQVFKLL